MNTAEKENTSMNFLRKMDKLCHSLSVSQGRMFEKSILEGIPSYSFIKSFMCSNEAYELDLLNLESAGITEVEIYQSVKSKIKTRRGEILSFPLMHFIGYFYRSASYMLGIKSRTLFQEIPVKFLVENYLTLHSLSIEEAIKEAVEANKCVSKSNEEKFLEIYKQI